MIELARVGRIVFAATTLDEGPYEVVANMERARRDLLTRYRPLRDVAFCKLVHGTNVEEIVGPSPLHQNTDGLFTALPRVALCVTGADCPPVLIVDAAHDAFALVHSGRKGTRDNIVAVARTKMKEAYATTSSSCIAIVGPGICQDHYEVDETVAKEFKKYPTRLKPSINSDHSFLDLRGVIQDELVELGIPEKQIQHVGGCTYEQTDRWFSHRRDVHEGHGDDIPVQLFCAFILV